MDPFRLLKINPKNIQLFQPPFSRMRFNEPDYLPEVVGGEWDKKAVPLESYDLYQAIQNRFNNQTRWENTAFYDRIVGEIQEGKKKFGSANVDEFRSRLDKVDDMYESIKTNGYQRQTEILEKNDLLSEQVPSSKPPEVHEVTVNISRDGELILHEGRHRLFISQIVDVDEIPVRVKVRHKRWMEYRDSAIDQKDIPDHPDLSSLT